MKTIYILVFYFLLVCSVNAQFGRRELRKDQLRESFVKLKYQDMNDSIVTGFGFPDPTSNISIVFSKERPTEEKTRDWKTVKVKYVELYYNKFAMMDIGRMMKVKYTTDPKFLTDTLRAFNLKNVKNFGVAGGLYALRYENESVRLFESIVWEGYYVPANLILLQTKESDPYTSTTEMLNYNNHKAFKRSAKRVFSDCTELITKINEGDYFPRQEAMLKKMADDFQSSCN